MPENMPALDNSPWFPSFEAAARKLAEIVIGYDLQDLMEAHVEQPTDWVERAAVRADFDLLTLAANDILGHYTSEETSDEPA